MKSGKGKKHNVMCKKPGFSTKAHPVFGKENMCYKNGDKKKKKSGGVETLVSRGLVIVINSSSTIPDRTSQILKSVGSVTKNAGATSKWSG